VTPLQEPTFLILSALAGAPLHGYGIIAMVTDLSEGRVQLRAGTLYPALDRLGTDGLIELAREEIVDNRLRRYYRLTENGARRLAIDLERQRHNAETAAARLAARNAPARPRDAARTAAPRVSPA
jgi:DNA-binding PadR family transcriptional regulator